VDCEKSINVYSTEECAICLNPFIDNNLLTIPCGHTYHTECILEWFDKKMTCPMCRKKFKWKKKKGKKRKKFRYRHNRNSNFVIT